MPRLFKIDKLSNGMRIDRWIKNNVAKLPQSLIEKNIRRGNIKINNITTLDKSKKFDLTFFDSIKYKSFALRTKASFCITTEKLKGYLPNNCVVILVKNINDER